MTTKLFSRGGLTAFLVALIIATCLAFTLTKSSFAQAPAPAEAPAAAAPACDAKTLEKCTPNSGDSLRVPTEVEREGLDITLRGEAVQ
jgi:hypothetical protein